MTLTAYMVWIVVMAIATITILTVGTLAAADMLHGPSVRAAEEKPAEAPNQLVLTGKGGGST